MTTVRAQTYVISDELETIASYSYKGGYNGGTSYTISTGGRIVYSVTASTSAGAEYHKGGVGYGYAYIYAILDDNSEKLLASSSVAYGGNGSKSGPTKTVKVSDVIEPSAIKKLKFSFKTNGLHSDGSSSGVAWGSGSGNAKAYNAEWVND